jgi:hypothetical protein
MPTFYFDVRDDGVFLRDEMGQQLAIVEHAQLEAATSLAEMARDDSRPRDMAIEVRDSEGPLVEVVMTIEVKPLG